MKFIFIGTPEFGAIILEKLVAAGYQPDLVITETDKPVGRKHVLTCPPVKNFCQSCSISLLQPEKIEDCLKDIENSKYDLGVVAAYGQILPKKILEIPKYGFINVHPSLLPKYRGPSPIQTAILNGDTKTGVTVMLLDDKMDHGGIISDAKFSIADKITFQELHNSLAEVGAKLLIETIPKWISGQINPLPQDDAAATYTKFLQKSDGRINWHKSALEIERQIRAFSSWPGSFSEYKEKSKPKLIKIWRAEVKEFTKSSPLVLPGKTFLATNNQIAVQTGKDYLIVKELQLEGGKRMSTEDFLKGHIDFVGKILE